MIDWLKRKFKKLEAGPVVADGIGPKLIDVVHRAYTQGFSTKSDFAREQADYVAIAACMGLISTSVPQVGYGRIWRATASGINRLSSNEVKISHQKESK